LNLNAIILDRTLNCPFHTKRRLKDFQAGRQSQPFTATYNDLNYNVLKNRPFIIHLAFF